MATKITNLKSFREETSKYLPQIKKGTSFVVFRRSKPIFTVIPISEDDDGIWETIGDFSQMKGGGISAKKLLAALKKA